MTRTLERCLDSRRSLHTHTQRLALLRSARHRAPPSTSDASTHRDCVPRSSAPCASLPSARPLPPLRRRGISTIVWPRGPTGLQPSTRKDTEMAKSPAKPASIPSYQQELEKLSAELKAAEEERAQLEAQWRQKYMPDVEELIEFARRRKHPWAQKIEPDNEGIVKETFLVWLYRSTSE